MTTWKNTQKSLNLPDSEFSKKVKNRIAEYEKDTADLAAVKKALATGKLSQPDKEEAEIAVTQLERRIFNANESLTKDMIRLDKDKEVNAKRRELLTKHGGYGRGRKKEKPVAVAAGTEKANSATTTSNSNEEREEPTTTTKPAEAPAADTTKPAAKPTSTTTPKKKSYAGTILGAIVAFVGGAVLGRKMQ